jgi:hypothetical protein
VQDNCRALHLDFQKYSAAGYVVRDALAGRAPLCFSQAIIEAQHSIAKINKKWPSHHIGVRCVFLERHYGRCRLFGISAPPLASGHDGYLT